MCEGLKLPHFEVICSCQSYSLQFFMIIPLLLRLEIFQSKIHYSFKQIEYYTSRLDKLIKIELSEYSALHCSQLSRVCRATVVLERHVELSVTPH